METWGKLLFDSSCLRLVLYVVVCAVHAITVCVHYMQASSRLDGSQLLYTPTFSNVVLEVSICIMISCLTRVGMYMHTHYDVCTTNQWYAYNNTQDTLTPSKRPLSRTSPELR